MLKVARFFNKFPKSVLYFECFKAIMWQRCKLMNRL